jgi:hypothetical protein
MTGPQTGQFQSQKIEKNKLLYQVRFMKKFHQKELKYPLIALFQRERPSFPSLL